MSEIVNNLGLGMSIALSPINVMLCLIGALLGTLVGVLPGLGAVATIAMLLPITYGMDPIGALIMLAGLYYGAQYGGSTTAILVNIPGEVSSLVTTLDGYQMARRGRAGAALAIAAIGSFAAGCIATVLVALFAVPLTSIALVFGPPEYFSLMVLGLICAVVLTNASLVKSLVMIGAGLLLSTVGADVQTGQNRLTLGLVELADGIDFVVLTIGVFGFSEILRNLESPEERAVLNQRVRNLMPTIKDLRDSAPSILRGTGLGSLLGVLPGGGTILATYASYILEKKISNTPEQFGQGAIQGVAGPESANNAAAQTSFIPLLSLGIPANAVMAMMVGAMMLHGLTPGPQIMTQQPGFFWAMIASMWIGNLMLLVINLPMVGIWVRLLKVPYRLLFPAITIFCCIGVYSAANSSFDVILTALFGFLGFMLVRFGFEVTPLVLAFVLGPMMEENLRRAILMSYGDPLVFVEEPISAAILVVAALMLLIAILPTIRRGRVKVFAE